MSCLCEGKGYIVLGDTKRSGKAKVPCSCGASIERKDKAKDRQVAGSHYKDMPIQPGEFIRTNGLGWYEGNAIKYICRYKTKGGQQDIQKAIHYLELLLEELEEETK
jgi:hypothetical protein